MKSMFHVSNKAGKCNATNMGTTEGTNMGGSESSTSVDTMSASEATPVPGHKKSKRSSLGSIEGLEGSLPMHESVVRPLGTRDSLSGHGGGGYGRRYGEEGRGDSSEVSYTRQTTTTTTNRDLGIYFKKKVLIIRVNVNAFTISFCLANSCIADHGRRFRRQSYSRSGSNAGMNQNDTSSPSQNRAGSSSEGLSPTSSNGGSNMSNQQDPTTSRSARSSGDDQRGSNSSMDSSSQRSETSSSSNYDNNRSSGSRRTRRGSGRNKDDSSTESSSTTASPSSGR